MATPEELIELSRSLRAGRAREMLHIRLPFAVPYIFSALKISITLADHRRGRRRVRRCRARPRLLHHVLDVVLQDPASLCGLGDSGGLEPGAVSALHFGAALVRSLVAAEIGTMNRANSCSTCFPARPPGHASGKLGAGVARQPHEDKACGGGQARRPQERPAENPRRVIVVPCLSSSVISTTRAPTATPVESASCWATETIAVARLISGGSISA